MRLCSARNRARASGGGAGLTSGTGLVGAGGAEDAGVAVAHVVPGTRPASRTLGPPVTVHAGEARVRRAGVHLCATTHHAISTLAKDSPGPVTFPHANHLPSSAWVSLDNLLHKFIIIEYLKKARRTMHQPCRGKRSNPCSVTGVQ